MMASILKIGISQNTKCNHSVGFSKSGHICVYIVELHNCDIYSFAGL